MTQKEAILNQKYIALMWGEDSLSFWFGTKCEKCCGVYPELVERGVNDKYHDTAYRCQVCGKQTKWTGMPWQAEEAWNNHEYEGAGEQLSFI